MRVRSRISRGYGPGHIRQDLSAKGVAKELIEIALEQAAINWLDHAEELLARRHRDYQETPQAWQKAARYLQRRGFPSDIVRRAVGDQPYA